ncbi:hypothetical protein COO60DRAFT_1636853 [Scenedesmus sp. NREL 46B-D3]|nr:hypothetical protein COO60DRAFT_1636853 [Scenedesmus sp. NREL 46B-D3]
MSAGLVIIAAAHTVTIQGTSQRWQQQKQKQGEAQKEQEQGPTQGQQEQGATGGWQQVATTSSSTAQGQQEQGATGGWQQVATTSSSTAQGQQEQGATQGQQVATTSSSTAQGQQEQRATEGGQQVATTSCGHTAQGQQEQKSQDRARADNEGHMHGSRWEQQQQQQQQQQFPPPPGGGAAAAAAFAAAVTAAAAVDRDRDRQWDRDRDMGAPPPLRACPTPHPTPPYPTPGAMSEEPPAVGSIHRGAVHTVKAFGVFVSIEGYRRHVLVHHSQVSDEVLLTRGDEDELKVKALEYAAPPGQRVWVKILEVSPDQNGPGFRVHGSMRVLDQDSGADLDPTGQAAAAAAAKGGGGGRQSDEPPEVGSCLRGEVKRIEAYGVFVALQGFRKYGLVHASQVANYLEFSAEDGEAERKKALGEVVELGQEVWAKVRGWQQQRAKVVEVGHDDRGPKIGCSMKLVDQSDGTDLDPQNLRYRPRGEGGQGGPGARAPVGASAGEVRGGAVDWGYLATRPDAFGSSGYDLLKDDPEGRGGPGAAGGRGGGYPPPPQQQQQQQQQRQLPPVGRGRGAVVPAWMSRQGPAAPGSAPHRDPGSSDAAAAANLTVEEALRIVQAAAAGKKKHKEKHKKHKKSSKHKHKKSSRKHSRGRSSSSDSRSDHSRMSDASASTRLRERGNQYYGRASATSHANDKASLLHVAKSLYEASLQMASTADEKASTHKNLGAALVQLAGLSSTTAGKRQQLLQSVHHKCQAYVEGPEAHKSEAWLETAWEAISTSVSLLTEQLSVLLQTAPANMGQVLQQLAELHAAVPEVICEWRLYSSRDLLGAVRAVAARLIGPPGAAAAEGRRGLGQLALDFEDDDEVNQLLTLEDELYVMECRACSTQARLQGEQLMQHTLCQRSDRLDRQAAADAAAQQQQQQHSDTARQDRDQTRPAAGAGVGAGDNAGASGGPAWAAPGHWQYRKAKRQHHRASQQGGQQQPAAAHAAPPDPAMDEAAAVSAAAAAAAAAAAEACERDGLLCALDLLKSAALLARERDLQAEAHALSSMGHLYKVCAAILDPALVPPSTAGAAGAGAAAAAGTAAAAAAGADALMSRSAEERSRDAFLRVLLLVDALPNKISLMMEDWYREARDSISEYQASRAASEEQQREAERAPVREALRAELQALYNAASKGWVELIKHCYDKHPPLNPANRLAPDTVFDAGHGKELLRRTILAYHPDKQGGPAVAFSWQVLAEEITKQLTRSYECFK